MNTSTRWTMVRAGAAGLVALAACTGAIAQSAEPPAKKEQPAPTPPAPPPPPAPAPKEPPTGDGELPGLDDLLGTGKGGLHLPSEAAAAADLKRRLDAKELGNAFQQAVTLMGDAATRLGKSKDAGIATQRVQDDVVKKLEILIAQAEQNSQSSSKPRPGQGTPDDPKSGDRQQSRGQRNQAGNGENNAELEPPSRQDGPLSPDVDAAMSRWGALPERVRNLLMQGSSDSFSAAYQRLTQAYYRKLAEEGKK